MRKQFLTTVAVAAAMALGASTASATPPDFPHNDLDDGNWTSVQVSSETYGGLTCDLVPCEFDSGVTDWVWESNPSSPYTAWTENCDGSIAGAIDVSGGVQIADATLTGFTTLCSQADPAQLPWAGQMCAHLPSGEIWLRQNIALNWTYNGSRTGVTFGQLTDGAGNGAPETLVFDDADSGLHVLANDEDFIHSAEFTIGQDAIQVTPDETETAPRSWTELGA